MTTAQPSVSILIPARNEVADIERCLGAVLDQDYPRDRMEVVLVDGGSTDGTARVARALLEVGGVQWRIVENSDGTTPSNLNAGLAEVTGEFVCRVDARSVIPADYVRTCSALLAARPEVSVTGGAQVAVPRSNSWRDIGIARALNNRFSMGGSAYRAAGQSGSTDTVYLGAFRASELRQAGGWDERMLTNQDFDLNRRLARQGLVWFDGRLRVGYAPRERLTELALQYHRFGRWKVRYWLMTGERPLRRQIVLLLSPAVVMASGVVVWVALPPVGRLLAALAGASGAAVIEARGAAEPRGGLGARLVAIFGMGVVASGWLTGVYREMVTMSVSSAAHGIRAAFGVRASSR